MLYKILSNLKYKIDPPKIDYGALYQDRPTDFEIVGGTSDVLDKIPLARNRFNGIQYNQLDVSPVSCTVHGAATALSALTGITFTVEDRKRIWEKMKAAGTGSELWGGYVESALYFWREWWNVTYKDDPSKQIEYVKVEMGSTQMYELIKKGYVIDMSYRGISGYNLDWVWDRVINQQWDNDPEKEEYGANDGWGHCLGLLQSDIYGFTYKGKFYNLLNCDNYFGEQNRLNNNIYAIDRDLISRLVENNRRIWNQYGYVFYFAEDFRKANIEVDRKLLERLSKAQPDSGRFVNLQGTNRYGIVQFGKFTELKGRDLSEGFALRNGSVNESLVLPLSEDKWISIGGNK